MLGREVQGCADASRRHAPRKARRLRSLEAPATPPGVSAVAAAATGQKAAKRQRTAGQYSGRGSALKNVESALEALAVAARQLKCGSSTHVENAARWCADAVNAIVENTSAPDLGAAQETFLSRHAPRDVAATEATAQAALHAQGGGASDIPELQSESQSQTESQTESQAESQPVFRSPARALAPPAPEAQDRDEAQAKIMALMFRQHLGHNLLPRVVAQLRG